MRRRRDCERTLATPDVGDDADADRLQSGTRGVEFLKDLVDSNVLSELRKRSKAGSQIQERGGSANTIGSTLDHLIGTWTAEEASEMEQAPEDLSQVDEAMWPPRFHVKEFVDRYVPNETFYLAENDRNRLTEAGRPAGPAMPAGTYARRIKKRLLIDLSWASSRMEGNTYSILDTERLLRYGEAAAGKDRKEALMILNHKEAIEYVVDSLDDIGVTRQDICNLHALLADGLLIDPAMAGRLRRIPALISHSTYTPLEDRYEIDEEFRIFIDRAAAISDPFEQSFFLLVHIPYLQAFDDVNKRTSRIASNIPLLKAGLAPMSFMTMDDRRYIDALIGIYELNNVALLREVYMEAYFTSAANYRTLRAEVETPHKAAVAYRDFVRDAVRRCVLEYRGFDADAVSSLAGEADIPDDDVAGVVSYTEAQFEGLHKGNAIRFRLRTEDLDNLREP